ISALSEKTKLVALNFVSNVTGTEQPIKRLIQLIRIHSHALVLVDAAQAISHIKIDLQDLDADFLAFSAHKIYGPNGLGVLTGKLTALSQLQPLFFGGKMVDRVSNNRITFAELPYRLEAGTPNIAGVIGFNAIL
ncbi:aminotransferase class V-fold PLP-dependent enzyme, partial [Haemophilus influenzae]